MGSFMSLFLVETAITCMTHIIYDEKDSDFQTIVFSINVTRFGCLFWVTSLCVKDMKKLCVKNILNAW